MAHWGSGVESPAWLLPLRILSEGHRQSGSLPVLLQALAYTRNLQVAINEQGLETHINAAWAHYGAPEVLIDALIDTLNAGITVVAAAGNDAVRDLAASPRLPASLMHPNLQVVASTDTSGELSRFSAFDPRYVTTLALGEDVLSLGLSQQPLSLNGSSVATALVSGLGNDSGTLAPSLLQIISPWLTSSYTPVVGAKKHLKGGRGDDWLQGLATDQTLNAGKGQNVLIGGGGADRFVVSADGRTDVIVDFNSREGDTLRILHAAKKNLWFDALTQTVWHDLPNDTTPAQAVVVLVGVAELPESAGLG